MFTIRYFLARCIPMRLSNLKRRANLWALEKS